MRANFRKAVFFSSVLSCGSPKADQPCHPHQNDASIGNLGRVGIKGSCLVEGCARNVRFLKRELGGSAARGASKQRFGVKNGNFSKKPDKSKTWTPLALAYEDFEYLRVQMHANRRYRRRNRQRRSSGPFLTLADVPATMKAKYAHAELDGTVKLWPPLVVAIWIGIEISYRLRY